MIARRSARPWVNGWVHSWDAIRHPFGYSQIRERVGKDIMLEEMHLYSPSSTLPAR